MKLSERTLTAMIKQRLSRYPSDVLWYQKISDRFTAGCPDFLGCFKGKLFAIEVKATGKKPRPIQIHTLGKIRDSGGNTLVVDNFELFVKFMEALEFENPQ